ncbi:MAG: NUDIX domain-containing protein [Pseudomonadota bacterium]
MPAISKACPVVLRLQAGRPEILAFVHPSAGKQFMKGTIEVGESPLEAARREMREESGLVADSNLIALGRTTIGHDRQYWHFFEWSAVGLPDTWYHRTEDDEGHTFRFFWHPVTAPLDSEWHPVFHQAFAFLLPRIRQF